MRRLLRTLTPATYSVCFGCLPYPWATVRQILPAGDVDVYESDGCVALLPATEEHVLDIEVPANRMTCGCLRRRRR